MGTNWFAPEGTEPSYEYNYGRQNWFDVVAEEHRAVREAVALFDLSFFTKVEVAGVDALVLGFNSSALRMSTYPSGQFDTHSCSMLGAVS